MPKGIDFTVPDDLGIRSGLRVLKYSDGDVLVEVMFRALSEDRTHFKQDLAHTWLSPEQAEEIVKVLSEEDE